MVSKNQKRFCKAGLSIILMLILPIISMNWHSTSANALESSYIISNNIITLKT